MTGESEDVYINLHTVTPWIFIYITISIVYKLINLRYIHSICLRLFVCRRHLPHDSNEACIFRHPGVRHVNTLCLSWHKVIKPSEKPMEHRPIVRDPRLWGKTQDSLKTLLATERCVEKAAWTAVYCVYTYFYIYIYIYIIYIYSFVYAFFYVHVMCIGICCPCGYW